MKRLRLYMIVFCVLVSLPLAYVVWRTFGALDRESQAQVRFFSERIFDEIEAELSDLVSREEGRAVDEYHHTLVQNGGTLPSPLASAPAEDFILGYLQNNPDGSFQTPLAVEGQPLPDTLTERMRQLQSVNTIFNQRKRVARRPSAAPDTLRKPAVAAKQETPSFADRFLKSSERKKSKSVLGQEQARVEEITAGQAMNLARQEPEPPAAIKEQRAADETASTDVGLGRYSAGTAPAADERLNGAHRSDEAAVADLFQVEVTPLQTVAIDADRVFIFRRVGINGQIYRQGFVLRLNAFLDHLRTVHYVSQPIARYTRLILKAAGQSTVGGQSSAQVPPTEDSWVAGRTFPTPFGFLSAEMYSVSLPPSPARKTLSLVLTVLGVVMVVGLFAIYQSARAVLDLSERRSRFVSAVTHELKTPLTNIRMYIEMLDQGIAVTPEREQDYLSILSSESARLSGLINNVLELSRLEKKTRRFDLKNGDLGDVLADVRSIMAEPLAREGFELRVQTGVLPVFAYDREVLVQVMINLMENSIKFGRHCPQRRIVIAADATDTEVILSVADTGPGIPRRALKRVFDDFYRVDNDLSRTTGGTGIGLALVKKFVLAMGGRVCAKNNDGPGCTIEINLPIIRETA